MSGRYPDLANYNDDFLVQTFQIQYPAPTSTDDAICMQNTYTVLRGGRELKDVDGYDSILSFPTGLWSQESLNPPGLLRRNM